MAKFNPMRDLMPADPFNVPAGQSSNEVESLRVKLAETKDKTASIVEVIKNKNSLLGKDLDKIQNLNRRLRRTIPRIPSMPGSAGVQFGEVTEERRRTGRKRPRLPLFLPSGGGVKTKVKRPKLQKFATQARNAAFLGSQFKIGRNITKQFITPKALSTVNTTTTTAAATTKSPTLKSIILGSGGAKNPITKKIVPKPINKKIVPITRSNENLIIPSNKVTTGNTIPYKIFPEVSRSGRIRRKGNEVLGQIRAENLIDEVQSSGKVIQPRRIRGRKRFVKEPVLNFEKQRTLFPTVPEANLVGGNTLIKQLRSGNLAKSKLYKTLGLDDKFTRNNFANYLEPANPKFQAKILKELGLLRGTSMKTPVSKDTFRFIMNAFKPSDFMLNQIKSGKMPTAIDPRINIFNKLKDSGYNIRLQDIVPKKDFPLLKKGLKLEDMPFKKDDLQLQLNVPRDLSSLNIDTGITNTVIILTDPPVA